jgi:hypothetical protein
MFGSQQDVEFNASYEEEEALADSYGQVAVEALRMLQDFRTGKL